MKHLKKFKSFITENLITEVGDLKGIKTFPYKQVSRDVYRFTSNVGKVSVYIEELTQEDTGLNVSYKDFDYTKLQVNLGYSIEGVDSQYTKSNPRELFKIIKTVVQITNDYIAKYSPYAVLFFGINKDGTLADDEQKNALYITVASKNLPKGYRLSKSIIEPPEINKKIDGHVLFKK